MLRSETEIKRYFKMAQLANLMNRCRCCLQPVSVSLPLQGYFEDLFFEVTNFQVSIVK